MKKLIELHQHDLGNFLFCRQKFNLSFNKKIFPKKLSRAINIGGLFHDGTYILHKGGTLDDCWEYIGVKIITLKDKLLSQKDIDEVDEDNMVITGMLTGYERIFLNKYPDLIIYPEYKIWLDVPPFRFVCTIDAYIKNQGKPWILELKTTTSITEDTIINLPVNFQILSYYYILRYKWLYKPVIGVIYRHIKKPSIRLKKTETKIEFQDRILREYDDDSYFNEEIIRFDESLLDDFKIEFYQKIEDLKHCYKTGYWFKNEQNCNIKYGPCPYLKFCTQPTQETLDMWYKTL